MEKISDEIGGFSGLQAGFSGLEYAVRNHFIPQLRPDFCLIKPKFWFSSASVHPRKTGINSLLSIIFKQFSSNGLL